MEVIWNIQGHDKVKKQLTRELELNKIAHAYLFLGIDGLGKFSLVRNFAALMQCDSAIRGCGTCPACLQVFAGAHFDTIELLNDAHSIKIATMRALIEKMNLSRQAKYKIAIIENLDRMTLEAMNAFLKTLEEPTENTVFLITASDAERILPTVFSRVRLVKMFPLSEDEMRRCLVEKTAHLNLNESDFELILKWSNGRIGKALSLANNEEDLLLFKNLWQLAEDFVAEIPLWKKFQMVDSLSEERILTKKFLEVLLTVLRIRAVNRHIDTNHTEKMLKLIDFCGRAITMINQNINSRLLIENLILLT